MESSTFSQYFNSPQFLDVINAYLEHKLICDFANADAKIKKHLKKSGIIAPKDIVEYVSENIHQMYIDNNVITIPTVVDIKKAVLFVLSAAEQTIARNLSPENTKITYLINARLDYHYQGIVDLLQKIQSTIAATREIKLLPSYENHEEIKNNYYSVLKEKKLKRTYIFVGQVSFRKFLCSTNFTAPRKRQH